MFARLTPLVFCCLLPLLSSQKPYRVADIEKAPRGTKSSDPEEVTVVGSKVFFTASVLSGKTRVKSLYALDLTTNQTTRLGPTSLVDPSDLVTDGTRLYFCAKLAGTLHLYSSDGTAAGTRSIGAVPGGCSSLTVVGRRLFFASQHATFGRELYTSDGISKIRLVMDIRKGSASSFPFQLTASGDVLFFTALDGSTGRELWRSEGSANDTQRVADIGPGSKSSAPQDLTAHYDLTKKKHTLVFSAFTTTHGYEPWVSDGTAAGTRLVADVKPGISGSWPRRFHYEPTRKLFYFSATTDLGVELWKTNLSTRGGTAMVKDIHVGPGSSSPRILGAHGGRVFLAADDGLRGRELWVSDGTASGTTIVGDLLVGRGSGMPGAQVAVDGSGKSPLIYFTSGPVPAATLWISDGTTRGTRRVKDFWSPVVYNGKPIAITPGAGVALVADDAIHGDELWRSDGTTAGTKLVADLETAPDPEITKSSNPRGGLERISQLSFVASDATQGDLAWNTDGTEAGTKTYRAARGVQDLTRVESGDAYCTVLDRIGKRRLQRLNNSNFVSVATRVSNLTPVGEALFYAGYHPTFGEELWIKSPTANGIVRDIARGRPSSNPRHLIRFRNDLYFIAARALWRSDGTAAGTTKLQDGARGPLVATANRVFFAGEQTASGRELWATDGTQAGTALVLDILPGTASSWPLAKTALGNTLLFTAVHPTAGRELWKSDGTAAGTVLVKDLHAGPKGTVVQHATLATDRVFFSAFGPKNHQLWVTDGTTAGTIMLTPGIVNAAPTSIVVGRGRKVWFAAKSWRYGRELWRTDGTVAGTAVVDDLMPGRASSNPEVLGIVESDRVRLLFAADDLHKGRELFALDLPGAARDLGQGCAFQRQPPRIWVDPTLSPLFTVAKFGGDRVRPNSSVFLLLSNKPAKLMPKVFGCTFFVDPIFAVLGPFKPTAGSFQSSVFVKADPTHLGAKLAWQAAVWPAPGWRGFDLSNGVITTYWQ